MTEYYVLKKALTEVEQVLFESFEKHLGKKKPGCTNLRVLRWILKGPQDERAARALTVKNALEHFASGFPKNAKWIYAFLEQDLPRAKKQLQPPIPHDPYRQVVKMPRFEGVRHKKVGHS